MSKYHLFFYFYSKPWEINKKATIVGVKFSELLKESYGTNNLQKTFAQFFCHKTQFSWLPKPKASWKHRQQKDDFNSMSQLFIQRNPPKKIRVFFRLTAEVPEMRKCGASSIQHVQLEARYLGGFFFSKLMKKPWIKAVVFGDFEKYVHKKRVHIRSYKHMSWKKGKNLKLSRSHQYLIHIKITPWFLLRPTYPTSCLVPCQVTRSVSRGQVFLYQLYTGLFSSFLSLRFVD